MKWYVEYWDIKKKSRYISDSNDLKGHDEWDFRKGVPVESWDDRAWIKTMDPDCDGAPEDVLQNHLGLPIFSTKMVELINGELFSNIEYLPIKVFRRNGEAIPGYFIANILDLVPAFDYKKSGYNIIPPDHINVKKRGMIGGIHKLVLQGSKLGEVDIFRLQEFTLKIILSEKFVKVFKENKLTGWVFSEVAVS